MKITIKIFEKFCLVMKLLMFQKQIFPIICERFREGREWRDVTDTMLFVHVSELTKP